MPAISQLPVATTINLGDLYVIVQGGITKQATDSLVLASIQSNIQITESQVTNLTSDLANRLIASLNLGDLPSPATARVNLGLNALTNGQLWIGSTGLNPVAANLTAGTGVSVVNAAGSITINSTGAGTLTGTANQVLVNGTSGVPTSGSITLTTPQDIAPTSSPTFNALTLTTPLSLTSGGSSKALTASAGGMVWTDSNSMEVMSGTSTALQMLQSGNLATPTWSTATWPAMTTINQLLYSSANNTVTGLATGTSSVLITSGGGVPSFSTTLPNTINLGTPVGGVLTFCTGLPISTGISGLGAGVATFLATPSSANLAAALTDETGSGANVFAISPTLVTPLLGIPTSGVLTNCTGLPISSGVSGLGTGVATFLATPSSANLAAALTDETGSGAAVFATSPTLVTPTLGAASATSLTFSSTTGIVGTTTNNNAAAGSVGEYISSTVLSGSAVSLTSGVAANITSISLTAGDWDVWGNVWIASSSTFTVLAAAINTTSATIPTAPGNGAAIQYNLPFTAAGADGVFVGMTRISISGTTTVYLVTQCNFASTASAFGFIGARRMR